MDQWLANIYGTGGGEDLEKTAQAVMLQKLAEEEGVDISGLDEAQLEALAEEVLGGEGDVIEDGGIDPQEQVEQPVVTEEQLAKEAQAKFEEADFLGRVMAHAYTQELEKIASQQEKTAGRFGNFGRKVKDIATGRQAREGYKGMKAARTGGEQAKRIGQASKSPKVQERAGAHAARRFGEAKEHRKSMLRGAAKTTGLYAGAGAAAYGAKKGLSKEASAFEKLAFEHAQQILGAAEQSLAQQQAVMQQPQSPFAAQPQQPQQPAPQQALSQQVQQQSPQFQQALDERALQILAENGYDVDAIVNQLEGGEGGEGGEYDGGEGDVQQ